MYILSIHTGHDASAAIFDDYKKIAIFKEERLSRIKNDGRKMPLLSINKLKEIIDFKKIDAVIFTKHVFESKFYKDLNIFDRFRYLFKHKEIALNSKMSQYFSKRYQISPYDLIDTDAIKNDLGLRNDTDFYFSNHHLSHALPTIYYNRWNKALLYTADGGGDFDYYSIYRFDNERGLDAIYEDKFKPDKEINSLGLMYSYVTKILGFKPNRHEGKITGLAAYGRKSDILKNFMEIFYIDKNGFIRINPKFKTEKHIYSHLNGSYLQTSKENFAFAAQYTLEYYMIESIKRLHQIEPFDKIGLSGGVFANVKLNQKISELPFIKDIFIFPPMGDEGLVIGSVFEYLINKKGMQYFLDSRKEIMELPYWGEEYHIKKEDIPENFKIYFDKDIAKNCAKLLSENKICAIFTKSMEYGPRALGARSILINPSDRSINQTVNKRLDRTEFMPFAPYVRIENLDEVFDFPESSRIAMRYMTVTCNVKEKWKDKIQATVHVDGTARPQSIDRKENSLYYDILYEFEKMTGIPCLVNTSFNAHEEPIINTFSEALNALEHDRIDYLITDNFIIGK